MIKLLVFDVDGTLSDGKVYYSQSGDEMKCFDVRDGLAISVWNSLPSRQSAIITGRQSQIVQVRGEELGIKHIYMKVKNKGEVLKRLLDELGLLDSEVACIGDDLNDISMFKVCKYAYMPANGAKELEQFATRKLTAHGGDGAVREMIELILRLDGESGLEKYFL